MVHPDVSTKSKRLLPNGRRWAPRDNLCNLWTTRRIAGRGSSGLLGGCGDPWISSLYPSVGILMSGGKPRNGDWRMIMTERPEGAGDSVVVASLSLLPRGWPSGRCLSFLLCCCSPLPARDSSSAPGAKAGIGRGIPPPSDLTCQPHSCHAHCNLRHLLRCSEVEEPSSQTGKQPAKRNVGAAGVAAPARS